MDKKPKALGIAQREMLETLKLRDGYWYAGCGWNFRSNSTTVKTLNTLAKRGLVILSMSQHGYTYTLTEK